MSILFIEPASSVGEPVEKQSVGAVGASVGAIVGFAVGCTVG